MRILIIGSGGREHTLAWKIAQSPKVAQIFCAPGNAGTAQFATNVQIGAEDILGLRDFAKNNHIDLTVVGPEVPLVLGIVDEFESHGLKVFGPKKNAALIEGSKIFAKNLMKKYNIPSADFLSFTEEAEAKKFLKKIGAPVVVKADGLAAGKGVIICQTEKEAERAIERILREKEFGDAGNEVIIEECLEGEEASILAFTDGKTVIPMVTSQDHKRINDGDTGPNTGGMGAYSPAPVVTDEMLNQILKEILESTISAMAAEGSPYKGVLYCGLMITKKGPQVLEFNCRFGDPETQAVLPRLKSDLVEVMEAVIDSKLEGYKLDWDKKAAVCVVLASGGYPGKYKKGIEIENLDKAREAENAIIFHAGTKEENGKIITSGGRVLGVTALGEDIQKAIDQAYKVVQVIKFKGMHYRRDIGKKALKYLK